MYFNYIQNIESFGVENSLAFLDSVYYNDISNLSNFVYIDAQSELSDIKLSITNIDYFIDLEAPQFIFIDFKIYYNIGATFDYSNRVLIHSEFKSLVGVPNTHNFIYDGLTNIPFIQNGEKLWIWFEFDAGTNNPLTSANNFVSFDNSGAIEINATSTAIDSVIKGVRYVDVFKENVKRMNGFEVDASRFDVGGEYYDQFAFTGNLIKQRNDVPFPVKFSELMEDLQELNCDYQVTDKIYIGQYQDFYPNYERGVFVSAPDDTFKSTFNDRYAINEYSFVYDNYEQDREEDNTTDAIHTDSQWLSSNKQVENTKEIKLKLIRDAYKIESIRKLGLKDTTSTDDDDKLAVIDVVPLSPSAIGGFTSAACKFRW